jgi:hypothetical protein
VFRADNAAGFGLCTCGSCSICTYTHRDPGLYTAYIYAYILYGVYTPYVYLTSLARDSRARSLVVSRKRTLSYTAISQQ